MNDIDRDLTGTNDADKQIAAEQNRDPITDAPDSHPLGTGIGSASGAATGAVVGAVGGPVGAAIGGVAGAVVGAAVGHKAGEASAESDVREDRADSVDPLNRDVQSPVDTPVAGTPVGGASVLDDEPVSGRR
jgi:phage tail tape-measure protein